MTLVMAEVAAKKAGKVAFSWLTPKKPAFLL